MSQVSQQGSTPLYAYQQEILKLLSGKLPFSELDVSARESIIQEIARLQMSLVKQNEELKSINASLEILEQAYRSMFLEAPISYVIIDDTSRIVHENHAFKRSFRSKSHPFQYLSQIIAAGSKETFDWVLRQAAIQEDPLSCQLDMNFDNKSRRILMYINRQLDQTLSYRLSLMDITDEHNALMKMEFFGYHDMLTETYNRFFLETEYRRINVRRFHPIALIMADIKSLRHINELYGHEYGDHALKEMARRLKLECRQEDIVVRLGGDKFVVLIPNITEDNLSLLTERLSRATQDLKVNQQTLEVTYGYALHSDTTESLDQLMHRAEQDLHTKKTEKV